MKYLLYCVFKSDGCRPPAALLGVGDEPVLLLTSNGLSAAVSRVAPCDVVPDIHRALAYARVVQSFHRRLTVIPMRYGCLFEEEAEVIRLLGERSDRYNALLEELDGCVEMGIRMILLPELDGGALSDETSAPGSPFPGQDAPSSGSAYLRARKAHYECEDQMRAGGHAMIEQCREAFAGLFVKCNTDASLPRSSLFSLYFLVPRGYVGSFREVFRQISPRQPAKLLLSGPWPPYNFVVTGTGGTAP